MLVGGWLGTARAESQCDGDTLGSRTARPFDGALPRNGLESVSGPQKDHASGEGTGGRAAAGAPALGGSRCDAAWCREKGCTRGCEAVWPRGSDCGFRVRSTYAPRTRCPRATHAPRTRCAHATHAPRTRHARATHAPRTPVERPRALPARSGQHTSSDRQPILGSPYLSYPGLSGGRGGEGGVGGGDGGGAGERGAATSAPLTHAVSPEMPHMSTPRWMRM